MSKSFLLYKQVLHTYLLNYPNSLDTNIIKKAYKFAKIVYYNENRLSGTPFLEHCLKVALQCATYKLDAVTVAAAILHDSFTFGAKKIEIESEVNFEVSEMLLKLEDIKSVRNKYPNLYLSENSLYSDYLRRLILVFGKDIRVVLIRLFEKYDSLQDCNFLPENKKNELIKNTFDIYANLAEMLGLQKLRREIEDAAFYQKDPELYNKLKKILQSNKLSNSKLFNNFNRQLKSYLALRGIKFIKIYGRVKGVYSFYKKINRYSLKYGLTAEEAANKVNDTVAFTILVDTKEDCYRIFSELKQGFKSIESESVDYIAVPKENGYQSIHIVLQVAENKFAEIQIKTEEMHNHNEFGGASHFLYKVGDTVKKSQGKINFLKKLLSWKENLKIGKTDFIEFEDTLLVITPKGEVIELPLGSTVLDFAYKIHSKLGEQAVKAKVNSRLAKLNTVLHTGDIVEIITDSKIKCPKHSHLSFVNTKKAKMYIKKHIKKYKFVD